MSKQTIAVLGTLALALGLAGPAGAASVVDITYDLADTTLLNPRTDCSATTGVCSTVQGLGGSMKIRYASNSASSMPILSGPVTLQTLTLNAHVILGSTAFTETAASLNLALVSPVAGSLLSGGTLTFGAAQIRATGTRHCPGHPIYSGLCIALFGTLTSLHGPLGPYTTTGTLSFAASPGPYGGAQSTRHTISGTIPAYAPSKEALAFGNLSDFFATGASLLGREILREAEGHDPKVIPEPGTLLLLGAGTAGLALVGQATRRSRET